jgi:hypothetical protein
MRRAVQRMGARDRFALAYAKSQATLQDRCAAAAQHRATATRPSDPTVIPRYLVWLHGHDNGAEWPPQET